MEEDTHYDYGPQDDTMKAMQSELQMKGVLMSKAWADLFGLFTRYQGELIKREHQLAVAQKEIIAKERHFKSHDEKFFKDSDLALIQSESNDKTHQISNLETDLRLKDDMLEKAKNEIMAKDEQLFKAQVDLKRLQYDMATKQEQLLAKDRLITRMQDEMAKESSELMVQIYQLREALKEEKMSHDRTRATSENFLKNLHNAKQSELRYEAPCRDTETPSENTSSSNSGAVIIEDRAEERDMRKVSMPEFNESGLGRVPKIRHFMARDRHSPPQHDTSPQLQLHERQQQLQPQQQQQLPQQQEQAVQRMNVRAMGNCITSGSDVKPDVYTLQRQWHGGESKVGLDLSVVQKIPNACTEKDHSRMGLTWTTTCSNSNVVENIISSFALVEPDKMPISSVSLSNNYSAPEARYTSGVVDRQPVFPGLIQPGTQPTVEISDGRSKSESSSNHDEGLQTSSSNPDGTSPPVCVPCKKVFFNEISYRKHLKNSHDRRFKCEECGKSFGTRIYLQIHLRTHTGEKPYKCKDCKKRFSVQSSLLRHIRIHTGEKPYKCEQCGWAFAVRSNLIQHIRTHSGERPYQCQYCMVRFTRQNSLQKHIVMTHSKEVNQAKAV